MLLLSGAAGAQEFYGTLKKIKDTNTITVGHREASIPFSYYDDKKQPIGYAMDLCAKVVDEVKKVIKAPDLQVKYLPVNAQTRIPLMANGTINMECGSTTNTLGRQQQVDFSAIYFTTATRVLARKAGKFKEIEDFQGKSIGLSVGSTNERVVKALIDAGKLKDIRILNLKDHAEALVALETDRIDGYASDDIVLYGLISKSRIKNELDVVGRNLSYEPYGVMLPRDDSAFRLVVNRTLAELFRSGEIEKIYAKWFDPLGVPDQSLVEGGVRAAGAAGVGVGTDAGGRPLAPPRASAGDGHRTCSDISGTGAFFSASRISAGCSPDSAGRCRSPCWRGSSPSRSARPIGICRTLPNRWLRLIGTAYVEIFRNVPLLLQMFLWFFVLPELLPREAGRWMKRDMPIPRVHQRGAVPRASTTPRASPSRYARASTAWPRGCRGPAWRPG